MLSVLVGRCVDLLSIIIIIVLLAVLVVLLVVVVLLAGFFFFWFVIIVARLAVLLYRLPYLLLSLSLFSFLYNTV